ncbi:hypothetical protein BDN72DRAFT_894954 [Pluteus cervinus]|uniref:Uncharacterized protein n=1 Tax=Pluteus cervinus TaxID=181527 RepID=A0ACD3B2N2_9AGAR|nr:hypothetical protein BDN72DRAFT_894954 [Pluteus cervinus]
MPPANFTLVAVNALTTHLLVGFPPHAHRIFPAQARSLKVLLVTSDVLRKGTSGAHRLIHMSEIAQRDAPVEPFNSAAILDTLLIEALTMVTNFWSGIARLDLYSSPWSFFPSLHYRPTLV